MEGLLKKYTGYLELERSISPLTVRNYTTDIRGFLDFLKQEKVSSLSEVDRLTMRRYLGWLQWQGIARTSISRKLSTLRSFYRYLVREELASAQPLQNLSAPKLDKRLPTFLTTDEVLRLLEAADVSTPQGLRDRAILELLYAAGLRVSEIVSLDLNGIDLNSLQLRVSGKGSKQRIALMGQPSAKALQLYLDLGRDRLLGTKKNQALLLNRYGDRISQRQIQNLITRYARKAGLEERVFPHIMRHTFATHLLDGGADLRAVQELLGHEKLSSTQIYTHVTRSQLLRSYLAAHPRSSEKGEQ
ncbi:tyrosine recombinase XerC [Chloroflexota bacterium]